MSPGLGVGNPMCLGRSESGSLLLQLDMFLMLVGRDHPGFPREQVPTGGAALLDPESCLGMLCSLRPGVRTLGREMVATVVAIASTPRSSGRSPAPAPGAEARAPGKPSGPRYPEPPDSPRWVIHGPSLRLCHPPRAVWVCVGPPGGTEVPVTWAAPPPPPGGHCYTSEGPLRRFPD